MKKTISFAVLFVVLMGVASAGNIYDGIQSGNIDEQTANTICQEIYDGVTWQDIINIHNLVPIEDMGSVGVWAEYCTFNQPTAAVQQQGNSGLSWGEMIGDIQDFYNGKKNRAGEFIELLTTIFAPKEQMAKVEERMDTLEHQVFILEERNRILTDNAKKLKSGSTPQQILPELTQETIEAAIATAEYKRTGKLSTFGDVHCDDFSCFTIS